MLVRVDGRRQILIEVKRMGNVSKIKKYELEDEARQLKDMGLSYEDISKQLKDNHSKIADLRALSAMSVMRYFDGETEDGVLVELDQGENPVSNLVCEFQDEVRLIHKKGNSLCTRAEKLLDKLETSDDDLLTLKAIKEVRDSYADLRKNYESLIKFGDNRFKAIQNVNLKKEVHVHNMLVGVTRNLCDECRRKISEELEKYL